MESCVRDWVEVFSVYEGALWGEARLEARSSKSEGLAFIDWFSKTGKKRVGRTLMIIETLVPALMTVGSFTGTRCV